MTFKELANHIAKIESKRREVSIGNIREMLSIVSEVLASGEGEETLKELIKNGKRRRAKKALHD